MVRFERRVSRGGKFEAWLFSIMRTVWRNQLKRRRLEQPFDEGVVAIVNGHAAKPLSHRLVLRDVARILAGFPSDWRELFLLVYVNGHIYQEAATLLDLRIGTVMSRLHRIYDQ